MAKVLGVGGVFFKTDNPNELSEWYQKWLGFNFESGDSSSMFYPAAMPKGAYTVWGPFKSDTSYFDPSEKDFMINLIVDDVAEALKQVEKGGAQVVGEIEELIYGIFGWFIDPAGTKIELWTPAEKIEGH